MISKIENKKQELTYINIQLPLFYLKYSIIESRKICIIRLLLFWCIIFLFNGCSTKQALSHNLLISAQNNINKRFKVKSGDTILLYNLMEDCRNNKTLFNNNYAKIINNKNYNYSFIKSLPKKSAQSYKDLNNIAIRKIFQLYEYCSFLKQKYNITISKTLANSLSTKKPYNKFGSLDRLDKINKEIQYLPIFFPQDKATITSFLGVKRRINCRKSRLHKGIDLQGKRHSFIYSAANGKVEFAGKMNGYGSIVIINHGPLFKTKYAHLSSIAVKTNDNIIRGQKIGHQGSTGNAQGEHLHFEVLFNNVHLNPIDFVASELLR